MGEVKIIFSAFEIQKLTFELGPRKKTIINKVTIYFLYLFSTLENSVIVKKCSSTHFSLFFSYSTACPGNILTVSYQVKSINSLFYSYELLSVIKGIFTIGCPHLYNQRKILSLKQTVNF
jgi:uncharacterized membrane protein